MTISNSQEEQLKQQQYNLQKQHGWLVEILYSCRMLRGGVGPVVDDSSSVYISDEGIANLNNYKPSSQMDFSFISKILNPYWNYVATWFPDWMAPNTITLIGFLAVVFSFIVTVYLNSLQNEEFRWIYLLNAVALFWYQTMDACDGKHARRTQTSSPLGELFDHGCDSINSLMQTVLALAAMQLLNAENAWICFFTLVTVTAMFYISIWQQYHTSVLNFQNFSGPTEGQFVVMLVSLVVFLFGPGIFNDNLVHLVSNSVGDESSVWYYLSNSPWFKLKYLIVAGVNVATISGVFHCVRDTIKSLNNQIDIESSQSQDKRANRTPVLKSIFSYIAFVILFVIWMVISDYQQVLQRNLMPVLYSYGMYHAFIVTRTILARVCDMTIPTLMPVLYFLIVGVLNSFFAMLRGDTLLDEGLYFKFLVIATTIMYSHLAFDVISTLTRHLGIFCFSVQKRNPIVN